jgi:hypothetical protein
LSRLSSRSGVAGQTDPCPLRLVGGLRSNVAADASVTTPAGLDIARPWQVERGKRRLKDDLGSRRRFAEYLAGLFAMVGSW